jgi:formylglycine-generating enzyme
MSCCLPSGPDRANPVADCDRNLPGHSTTDEHRAGLEHVPIPAGRFRMGDPFAEGYPRDGETVLHDVEVDAFTIARTAVTNEVFAGFVADTGYRTTAEVAGSSAVFHSAVHPQAADNIVGAVHATPWWAAVRGADWAHPTGPGSSWSELPNHPVVHVSWYDAVAFFLWRGSRLPTEAEWEYAARGELNGKRFPWGDELEPDGTYRLNIFRGTFPTVNAAEDGYATTAPVDAFEPNGYGLYNMCGNVWEWCFDWFDPRAYARSPVRNPAGPTRGRERITRGGSYLCHISYCYRYRVAARSRNTPDSSTGNCGFRTVLIDSAA